MALAQIVTETKAAVPYLVNALKDKDAGVRGRAAMTLGSMGTEAKAAVPDLANVLLNDKEIWVNSCAAGALGSIAFSLQEKANTLSPKELDKAISDLEAA